MKGKFKRIIAYIIVFTLLFSVNINIYADLIESQNEDVVSEESGEPEEQDELEELDEPELPEEPQDPEEPEVPEEPEHPENPENPIDPEEPVDLEEQLDPEEPLDPEDPLDPEAPIDPENPEVPEIPVIPEVPIVLEFQYEIDFLVVDTLEPVPGLESITGIAELGDIIDIPHPEAEGYMILEDQLTELVIEENEELNKVIIYYELIPLVENYQYEIDFLVVDTLEPVPGLEPIAGTAALGDIIDIPHLEAEGYKVLEDQLTELIIEEDEELNRVVIFYEPIKNLGSLIINHIYYSNDELITEVEVKELEIDHEVVPEEFALSRDDLEYAGSDVEGSLFVGIEPVEMNLHYNANVPVERQEREDVDFFNQRLRMRLMNNGPEPNEPGAVFIDKYAEWVDKENGLGKVTLEVNGNPIQKGSDVLLILDSSGSMSGNRMTKTKAAAKAFVEELYEQNGSLDSDNRIALITFSDNASKYPNVNNGEVFLGVDDSVGQRDAEEYFRWRIDQMNANGGTNYDNAFELAENILNGRVDDSRPTYVVFMSDGEPNEYWWLGWHYYDGQEAAARIRADGTTIYSLGLEIGNSAFNNFIRPLASGSSYAFNISNTNELSPIFASIAGEIKIAGTNAVITDYINTDYFDYVSHETDYGTVNVASDGKVTWNVGNITDTVKTLTINIRLKDSVVTAGNYETNFSADLEYVDYNDENKDKIFPVPVLDVGDTGYISMKYYLVNELGKPVTSDGLTELDFSQRIQLHSELFIDPDANSENLNYNKAYTVEPPSTITINGEVYQYVPLSASNGGSPSSEVVILLPNSSSRTFNYGYMKQQLVTVNFNENYPDAPAPYNEVLNINTSLGQNMPLNPERNGYTFDGWFPNSDGSGNEFTSNTIVTEDITVYAKWSLRTDISYTVEYELSDGTKLLDDKIVGNQIFGTTVDEDAVAILGYVVDEDIKSLTLGAEANVITFIYSPRTDISYTVEYELSDGTKLLDDKVVGNQIFGSTVNEDAVVIPGYVVDEDSKSLTLGTEGNIITFIYSPRTDISYTVEYELSDGTKLLDDKVVGNQIFGSTVNENAEIILGYIVDEDSKSLTLDVADNVITFIYSPREDISYTVEYELSDGTKLLDDKLVGNQIFGTTVDEDAEVISGYVVDEDSKSLTLDVEDNIITFVYTPRNDISYTVEYELSDGTKLLDDKVVENQIFGTTVDEDAVAIPGYVVDEESKSLTLGVEDNVITFIYSPREDISYTVEYELEDGTKLLDDKLVENQIFGTTVGENAEIIPGYVVDEDNKSLTLGTEGNIITFIYSPRTDISYTVEYELSDGTKLLDDKIVENQIFGITVNEDAVAIPGYVVDEDIKSLTLDVEDNVITFIYSPRADISYIVEYELSDGTKLIDDKLVENQEFGSTVNEDAVVILGYVVDEESKSLILGAEANVITFVYTPRGDISYTVNYLEQGTNQVLAQQKVVEDQTFGSEITETAINIAGYNKVEPTEATITLDIEGNEITFFYTEIEQPEQPEEPEEPENPGGGGGGGSRDDDDDDDEVEILEEAVPQAAPELNIVDHIQYIQGYPDNTVRPEGLITREEVAAVFYRLLTDSYRESIWTQQEDFPDVNENRWSLRHIATLANGGIIEGYPDGSFRPGSFITRAELATIASKFDNLSPFESNSFSDIEGHWANRYINSASQKGWVTGYPDGTFKPNQYITRAEFVTLVNNVLGRRVHSEDILPEARRFPDLLEDKWYYEAMQEAIDSHFYIRLEDSYEEWTDIYYPVLDM
jgi:uncharacterized repeat protein (TIGR02543 family)